MSTDWQSASASISAEKGSHRERGRARDKEAHGAPLTLLQLVDGHDIVDDDGDNAQLLDTKGHRHQLGCGSRAQDALD